MAGETGIDCFDAWSQELVETGYLHNHARMWTASIWIHTLKLPWELGADWFLRHLLDGDPASNTLSWRWVAGLHTAGKTYLATRENIRRFTGDRFAVTGDLATTPVAVDFESPPAALSLSTLAGTTSGRRNGFLLTDEDLSAAQWLAGSLVPELLVGLFPREAYERMGIAEPVARFRREAMQSALASRDGAALVESVVQMANWIRDAGIDTLLMAEPPVGIWTDMMPRIVQTCEEAGVQLSLRRHGWDHLLWPHAAHGFFRFKKAIPQAIARLSEW